MSVITVRREDGLAVLTIDAPPLNLYTSELHDEFMAALAELEADPPRVLLIEAKGKVVSGGVDVAMFGAQPDAATAKQLFDRMAELPEKIAALPYPTVFAAHGLCLTWAFEVALACDLLVASPRASFGLVEKVIGLTPTMGGTQRLAARAGVGRAKEFVFSGGRFDAQTMADWNVVNRILAQEDFPALATEFAAGFQADPTKAHAATKQVLRHFEHGGVAEANEHVTTIAANLYDTEDLRNGIATFLREGPGHGVFHGR